MREGDSAEGGSRLDGTKLFLAASPRTPSLTVGLLIGRAACWMGYLWGWWYSDGVYTVPLAYFISFRTYGSWLHGDVRGSVDRRHNQFDSPLLPVSKALVASDREQMPRDGVVLSLVQREIVTKTITGVCEHKGWRLLACNVRTNHVHTVVSARPNPELVMNAFKSWATRRLVEGDEFEKGARVWSRHGSTVYLFKEDKVAEKCRYVVDGQ